MITTARISTELKNNYSCIALKHNLFDKEKVTQWYIGYRFLLNYMQPVENMTVLDVGRDNGAFYQIIRECNANVMGIDLSEKLVSVSEAGRYNRELTYKIDPGLLDFLPEDSFDYVVSRFAFNTILERRDVLKAMISINRSMKRDGTFIIMNHNWDKSNGKEFISFNLEHKKRLHSGNHVATEIKSEPRVVFNDIYWSKADYSELLTESGFMINAIYEPLAKGDDLNWLSEKSHPPFCIFISKKS